MMRIINKGSPRLVGGAPGALDSGMINTLSSVPSGPVVMKQEYPQEGGMPSNPLAGYTRTVINLSMILGKNKNWLFRKR